LLYLDRAIEQFILLYFLAEIYNKADRCCGVLFLCVDVLSSLGLGLSEASDVGPERVSHD